jgi:hypothetical protein
MQDVRWSTGAMRGRIRPNLPTEFEQVVSQLGLESEADMVRSRMLYNWVSHNRTKRYVPESILRAFHAEIRDDEIYAS